MTFSQRIRSLSVDDLQTISSIIEKEAQRRHAFFDRLKTLRVKELCLTISTRDLLHRTVANKTGYSNIIAFSDLSVKDLFTFLKREDWLRIQYVSYRSFLEVRDALNRNNAPLDSYYGLFGTNDDESARIKATNRSTQKLINQLSELDRFDR